MFNNLTKRMSNILRAISNKGRITEKNIELTLREVRVALLEADVALPVIKQFIYDVKSKAIGKKINNSLTPGQELIKIFHTELIAIIGKENHGLTLNVVPPVILLIMGLQGSGKTTSVAKIGNRLKTIDKKKVLVVSTDIYRPAAIKQLELLSLQSKIDFFKSHDNALPIEISKNALEYAKRKLYDVLIIDTAGRLYSDKKMMEELQSIYNIIKPIETLFVIDAMTGQDSINIVKNFNKYLPISGIILTKSDGDSRGGSALSVSYVTGKPIKFIGTGENVNSIELFCPHKIASRILGMGDILSLIQTIEKQIDTYKQKKIKQTINNHKFNFNDFILQIKQMNNLGGISKLINKLPQNQIALNHIKSYINDKTLNKFEIIINSMTKNERLKPEMIKGSQKRRISMGSGISVQEINQLLKKFYEIKNIMKKIKKSNMNKILQNITNLIPK